MRKVLKCDAKVKHLLYAMHDEREQISVTCTYAYPLDLEEVVELFALQNGRAIKFAVTLNVTVAPCCDTDYQCYTNNALAFCIVGNKGSLSILE